MSGIKVVFGGGAIRKEATQFSSPENLTDLFSTLTKYDVKTIDSAQLYGESEEYLGAAHAGNHFVIDTKWTGGFVPGSATKDKVISSAKESIARLKIDKVDIFYLHAPEKTIPIEETLEGVNEVYKLGFFKRFGLSNYSAEDVQRIYDLSKEKGWVLPTAYQGNYSPVARKQETILFPTLRKLGIAFYAYSPLAGGFLTKTKQDILDGKGRFDSSSPMGKLYSSLYNKPTLLEALASWSDVAKSVGISNADLAYRWVTYNSPLKPEQGDAIIFGGRTLQQIEQTLKGIKAGPLPKEALDKIDAIWETIKDESPLDNYHG